MAEQIYNSLFLLKENSFYPDELRLLNSQSLSYKASNELKLYTSSVSAGFPSPADDHLESSLDLNQYLIKHPAATFMVKMIGDGMKDAAILDKDILIVDRSLTPTNGRVVVAIHDGQLIVRIYHCSPEECLLIAGNRELKTIKISRIEELNIWGVVSAVIRQI